MYAPRDDALACARLAEDEDRNIGVARSEVDQLVERGRSPGDRFADRFGLALTQVTELTFEARPLRGTADRIAHDFKVHRLLDEIGGAVSHRSHGRAGVGVAGPAHDSEVRGLR